MSAEILPVSAVEVPARATRSPAGLAFRRFRRNRLAVVGAVVLLVMLVICFGLPLTGQLDPTTVHLTDARQQPGDGHVLGTDAQGRDVLARLVYAACLCGRQRCCVRQGRRRAEPFSVLANDGDLRCRG